MLWDLTDLNFQNDMEGNSHHGFSQRHKNLYIDSLLKNFKVVYHLQNVNDTFKWSCQWEKFADFHSEFFHMYMTLSDIDKRPHIGHKILNCWKQPILNHA